MNATASVLTMRPALASPLPRITGTRHGPVAMKAFTNISAAWKLSEAEQLTLLGDLARATFYRWKTSPEKARPSHDMMERISYILGIYKALTILLPDREIAAQWVRQPNRAEFFGGRSALEVMLGGSIVDLYRVRSYLDGQRGW